MRCIARHMIMHSVQRAQCTPFEQMICGIQSFSNTTTKWKVNCRSNVKVFKWKRWDHNFAATVCVVWLCRTDTEISLQFTHMQSRHIIHLSHMQFSTPLITNAQNTSTLAHTRHSVVLEIEFQDANNAVSLTKIVKQKLKWVFGVGRFVRNEKPICEIALHPCHCRTTGGNHANRTREY